jgi:hypothetical protein
MVCYFGKLTQIGFILQHLPVHKPSKGWIGSDAYNMYQCDGGCRGSPCAGSGGSV